jgi:hypothetical protein
MHVGADGRPLQNLKASVVKLKVDGKDVAVEGLDRVGTRERGIRGGALLPSFESRVPSPESQAP